MSTFDGVIKEIPYLRVDRFDKDDKKAQIHFISHCHKDHMEGLDWEFFTSLKEKGLHLYASHISAKILENTYPHAIGQLKEIFPGDSTLIEIDYNGETTYLNVSTIPAGHCPGSVMFLFETTHFRVLYTGDFRIDDGQQFFTKYFNEMNKIDALYLDTTFCSKRYPHFPSRKESLNAMCKLIKEWIVINDGHIVNIQVPAHIGSEYLLREIFKETKQRIHVSDYMYSLHAFMPEMNECVTNRDDDLTLRIHISGTSRTCCPRVTSSQHVRTIRATAMVWQEYNTGDSALQFVDDKYYKVCVSYHPSYTETYQFIQHLKPARIVPCVVPENDVDRVEMQKVLSAMLNSCSRNFEKLESFQLSLPQFRL